MTNANTTEELRVTFNAGTSVPADSANFVILSVADYGQLRAIQQKFIDSNREVENLRGLLMEALEDGYIRVPYGASHEDVSAILDFEKRIREAI